MLSRQEIFDKVLDELRTQGSACVDMNRVCRYRDWTGNKCAVGHLIPDGLYDKNIEGTSVNMPENFPSLLHTVLQNAGIDIWRDWKLLQRLQFAHDQCLTDSISAWEFRMRRIADDFELVFKEPAK